MILLDNIARGVKGILGPLTLAFPTNRSIALLGQSEKNKQYLINIITGTRLPDQGTVKRNARVSFPVGRLIGFDRSLSVRRNVAHIARLYGADPNNVTAIVGHVIGMDAKLDSVLMPGETVGSEIAEALAFAIPFDFYVLASDKIGPDSKTWELFRARQRTSGMLIPTNNPQFVLENCDMGMVMHDKNLVLFEQVNEALQFFSEQNSGNRL